jgi:SAM-dependent methyltransferase
MADEPQRAGTANELLGAVAPQLRRLEAKVRTETARLTGAPYPRQPARMAVRTAYNVLLRREPDEPAWTEQACAIAAGTLSRADVVDRIRCSNEFRTAAPPAAQSLHSSLHASRCEFIAGLPPARHIVDLGGGHTTDARGALVVLGYPYDFEELVVVDLPPDDRHPLYHSERFGAGDTDRGTVRYEYRSMADLGFAEDSSVDLIYSGQSIEHVTETDGDVVLKESFRILRPGGYMAIDTPNGTVCRLQQDAFIDPDHKVEYTLAQLRDKVQQAGFTVLTERGLNWGGAAAARGIFDPAALAAHYGVFFDAEHCYLLALLLQKPAVRTPD